MNDIVLNEDSLGDKLKHAYTKMLIICYFRGTHIN
jgi:hypothetical protein